MADVHTAQSVEHAVQAPLSTKNPLLQAEHLLKSVLRQVSQLATAHLVLSSHL